MIMMMIIIIIIIIIIIMKRCGSSSVKALQNYLLQEYTIIKKNYKYCKTAKLLCDLYISRMCNK